MQIQYLIILSQDRSCPEDLGVGLIEANMNRAGLTNLECSFSWCRFLRECRNAFALKHMVWQCVPESELSSNMAM